ncbi:MAG: FHA domain-containing protein [Bradymonadales bacterium]|nr:FHA domain-containing protein [Bradymonadales bacterium]
MPKQCPECRSLYPNFVDFCIADGLRLVRVIEDADQSLAHLSELAMASTGAPPASTDRCIEGRARLIPKVKGEITHAPIEFYGTVVLGCFDPSVGVVDIDLSRFPGHEYISPRHAKLIYEDGRWLVEDLESGQGVFIDRDLRVMEPVEIRSGQELALGNALFLFEADEPEETTERGDEDTTPLEGSDEPG